jgi:hypothetical protein
VQYSGSITLPRASIEGHWLLIAEHWPLILAWSNSFLIDQFIPPLQFQSGSADSLLCCRRCVSLCFVAASHSGLAVKACGHRRSSRHIPSCLLPTLRNRSSFPSVCLLGPLENRVQALRSGQIICLSAGAKLCGLCEAWEARLHDSSTLQ